MWTPQGVRPIVITTGSHQKTCVFGTLAIDGRQLFRQYDAFNQYTFLDYLKEIQKKFGKVILFTDRARQHQSRKVRKYLEENKHDITAVYLPKGSPEFNAIEECWRQGKYDLLVSKYYCIKNSNRILLDSIKEDIKDAYAKGKISEQHYKLLNEKLSDNKNNQQSDNNQPRPSQNAVSMSTTQDVQLRVNKWNNRRHSLSITPQSLSEDHKPTEK